MERKREISVTDVSVGHLDRPAGPGLTAGLGPSTTEKSRGATLGNDAGSLGKPAVTADEKPWVSDVGHEPPPVRDSKFVHGRTKRVFMEPRSWQALCEELLGSAMSIIEIGIHWRCLILIRPGLLGGFVRSFPSFAAPSSQGACRVQRGVLPVTLPAVLGVAEWEQRKSNRSWHRSTCRVWVNLRESVAAEVWMWLVVACLKYEYSEKNPGGSWAQRSVPSQLQVGCMGHVRRLVIHFCQGTDLVNPSQDWEEFISCRTIDYGGGRSAQSLAP